MKKKNDLKRDLFIKRKERQHQNVSLHGVGERRKCFFKFHTPCYVANIAPQLKDFPGKFRRRQSVNLIGDGVHFQVGL